MGANESREAARSTYGGEWRPLAINASTFDSEFLLPSGEHEDGRGATMGQSEPPSRPGEGTAAAAHHSPQTQQMLSLLARQHERLILELFTFKDGAQFQAWLRSPQVRGSWLEFRRDSAAAAATRSSVPLPHHPAGSGSSGGGGGGGNEEMDKAKAAQQAKDAVQKKSPRYLLHYPDKRDWTADDHTVRFIAVVIYDNLLTGMWSSGDWSCRALDIAKSVYEVLVFLRSTDPMAVDEASPPDYTA
ncbi:hypothetical protein RB597_002639 [Gaeumannomyces tritici]